jgi:Rne/Rng family ribonuclease
MTKELIISANVHEKKVCILEDGLVTEFYVERRDENQGVVGNLYKGRVMKVLPGMQSAFVDIGLERDAFLYVSDFTEFMEEEEEIDFKEGGDETRRPSPPSQPRPQDRSRRGGRFGRDQAPQPRGPQRAVTSVDDTAEHPMQLEDAVEQLEEINIERVIPPPEPEPDEDAELSLEPAEAAVEEPEEEAAIEEEVPEEEIQPLKSRRGRGRGRKKDAEASSRAPRKKTEKSEEEGEDLEAQSVDKRPAPRGGGARRPARRRGEEAPEVEGALTETSEEASSSFERITDEDSTRETGQLVDAGDLLKDAILQEKFIERVHEAEYSTRTTREPEPEWRVGSFRTEAEASFERIVDESAEPAQHPQTDSGNSLEDSADTHFETGSSGFRHIQETAPQSLLDRARSWMRNRNYETSGLDAGPSENAESETPASTSTEGHGESSSTGNDDSSEDDRDARISDRPDRAELAVRRGGRGRRRRPRDAQAAQAATAATPDEESAAPSEESAGEAVAAAAPVEQPSEAPEPTAPAIPRAPAPGRDRRPLPPQRRPDLPRRPDRPSVPTISELLHEGQEILVQIAKEPIAKKGARITSHIALPGRYLVYMPTVNHVGVSRKIASDMERVRLKRLVTMLREREGGPGGFIARTACASHSEQELQDDMRYLIRTWTDVRKKAERSKSPSLVHRDLDLVQRILRDQISEEFTAIRVDNEVEYARIVEFVNRVQPKLVKRVKLYTGTQPILEKYNVQAEVDKAVRPRVWLRSGGYIVINQTEALVAIDVNTGKFVGKSDKLEDTITRTNLEAAKEIVRQVRLRDLGGIIVIDFIDMEERKNRQRVMMALQQELQADRAPSKILSINDFGLVAITRKRVKQSLERTLCTPCPYCSGAGMVKSAQTMCFEILEQAKAISKQVSGSNDVMLRVSPGVAEAFRSSERNVLEEVEAYFGMPVTIEADPNLHQEQYDFAIV